MDFVENLNEKERKADLLLFGEIGSVIDGHAFAKTILYFIDYDEITIHINSVGGSIVQGNSIIAAMSILRDTYNIRINTINRGIADSMAGMILANGDKGRRYALDFSSALVHEPLVESDGKLVSLSDMPEGEQKEELVAFKTSLLTNLSANTGKDLEYLSKLMEANTRLDAKGLVENGFVDKIKKSQNKPKLANECSRAEMMAACSDLYLTKNKNTMINDLLNLSKDASEDSILEGVKKLKNVAESVSNLEVEKEALAKEVSNLKDELKLALEKITELQKKEIEGFVDVSIKEGKITKEKREDMILNASKDFELFKSTVGAFTAPNQFVDVTSMIVNSTEKKPENDFAETYANAFKNGTLADLRKKGEDYFNKCESAYINSSIDIDKLKN